MTDIELLAKLVKCEAGGEGYQGMQAVATVVMNRVRTFEGEYGRFNTIREVVYQPRQFECALSGRPQSLFNMVPEQIHFEIAQNAINGLRLGGVAESLWFFNPFSEICPPNFPSNVGGFYTRIGMHCFYYPTSAYFST